jgi:hypothetical protein
MRKELFAGLVVALGIFAPPKARAQDEHARADALYRQGAAAAQRGEHDRAYAAFAESYRLWPRGATLGNVGWAEVELGHLLEGFGHLKQAARAQDLDDHRRAVIQQNIDEVYAQIGHLAIDADPGAKVTVDGIVVAGLAPFVEPIDVLPGRRAIEATLATRTTRAVGDAAAGTVVRVDLRAAPAEQDATASSPTPSAEMLASEPLLIRRREGQADLKSPSWWSFPHVLGVGLGAVALAGAGTALSFAIASQAAGDDARNLRASIGPNACAGSASAQCANLKDRVNAVHTDDSIAQTSLVVGGVAAVGAAIAFVVGAQHNAARTPTIGWTVGPASAAVWGRF